MSARDLPEPPVTSRYGRLFWAGVGIGWALIGFGVVGALRDAARTNPPELVLWLLGSLVAHDLVIAPATFAVGAALRRSAPRSLLRPLQAALILSGIFVLFSITLLGGWGRDAGNPSILPRNYAAGLLVALAVVWGATSALAVIGWLRRRRIR